MQVQSNSQAGYVTTHQGEEQIRVSNQNQVQNQAPPPGDTAMETATALERRTRDADTPGSTSAEQRKSTLTDLQTANQDVQNRLSGSPDGIDFSRPDNLTGPDAAYRTRLDAYWNASLTAKGSTDTRRTHAAEAEKTLLSRNAAMGVANGELTRSDQARVDKLRANPDIADRAGKDDMPGVYSLAGSGPSNDAKVEFSGMYVITERPAKDGELTSTSDVGTALLAVPGQPLRKFDSMQTLTQHVESQLNAPAERDALLKFTEDSKRDTLSNGSAKVSFDAIPGNVFVNRLESQIKQQGADLDNLARELSTASVTSDQAEQRGQNILEGVRKNSDMTSLVAQRLDKLQDEQNLATMKSMMPEWLKSPPAAPANEASSFATEQRKADWESERKTYLGLADKAADKQIEASKSTADVLSLNDYTDLVAKSFLTENGYPDVDPLKVEVDIVRYKKQTLGGSYQSPASQETTVTKETISLADLLQRNYEPRPWGTGATVTLRAGDGKVLELGQVDIKRMGDELDVGKNYTNYLKDSFISSSAAQRREKLQQADRAVFEKDISQAKLQGVIGETQDKRGTKWAEAILNHPDPASRPKVDGYTIEASKLGISGNEVTNVYVIGPKEKDSMHSVLLYMPDAPNGKALQEFSNRTALANALKSDDLREYLLKRVDPGAREAVRADLKSPGGISLKENAIEGKFFDAMYEDRVNRTIVDADRATRSNAEVKKQTVLNAYNWGLEFVTPIPLIGSAVDLGQAGVGFFNSAEAARNGDAQAAKDHLFDAVSRILSAGPGVGSRKGGSAKSQTAAPPLTQMSLNNTKTGYQFSAAKPDSPSWKLPTSYGVAKPSDIGEAERGVYSATRNGQKHEYIQIDGQFYESGQNGKGRYIQRPRAPTERMQIVRSNDKWQLTEPPSRGLLGGGSDTPAERLTSLSNRLRTQGIANADAYQRVQPELSSYLAAPANQPTFSRLVDLSVAEGRLSVADRSEIMASSTPYGRASRFTDIFLERNSNGVSALPDLLSQVENNGPRSRSSSTGINDATARDRTALTQLANSPSMSADTFQDRRNDISRTLARGGNHETFNRLVDLATAEGQLTLAERAEITRQSSAFDRASTFSDFFLSRNSDRVSTFPDLLKQAQDNGPRASAAPATIRNMVAQERSRLEHLPGRLTENGPFDSAGLARHRQDLIDLLSADSNRGVYDRLLDGLVANGTLNYGDRHLLNRIQDPYERGSRLLDTVQNRLGEHGLARFPNNLRQAIARTPGATMSGGPLDSRAGEERTQSAGLPERLRTAGIANGLAFQRMQPELASYLADDANRAAFHRLIDLSVAQGQLTLANRSDILRQPTSYQSASMFTEHFLSRSGDRVSNLPDLLSRAGNNGPEAVAARATVHNLIEQERTSLANMPARLTETGAFDNAAFLRHRETLIGLLTADSNRGVSQRLLDIMVANGDLTAADRHEINRIRDPYRRGGELLDTVRDRLGLDRLARFPAALERAVAYERWTASGAPATKPTEGSGPAAGAR